jgi:glucose-1-phosphate cytidylyltransferase
MQSTSPLSDVPVVILCGGMGMRLKEETEFRPKPMVEIGQHPILWHIMQCYSRYGFQRFILCLGFRGKVIKEFFLNYSIHASDVEVHLGQNAGITVLNHNEPEDWTVTLADTGLNTMTGGRVRRIQKYVKSEHFMLTYGDAVSDVDLGALYQFHLAHGKAATVTGVCPPSRFGELEVDNGRVTSFSEKPVGSGLINGGFFVFSKKLFDYLPENDSLVLEREPLEGLSRDGELMVRPHEGFWQCMDTLRDVTYLRSLADSGQTPWLSASGR